MMNPFAILFGIISFTEPAIEDDDTVPFTPVVDEPEPILCTRPIDLDELHNIEQIEKALVAYRLTSASPWQIGNIRAVEDTRFGFKALFTPKDSNLPEKWRFLDEVVYAWWAVAK